MTISTTQPLKILDPLNNKIILSRAVSFLESHLGHIVSLSSPPDIFEFKNFTEFRGEKKYNNMDFNIDVSYDFNNMYGKDDISNNTN